MIDIEKLNKLIISEGDYKEFYINGLLCTIERNMATKALCGYIDITEEFPEYGKENVGVICHGGITFTDYVDGKWRIGFDCSHSSDLIPIFINMESNIFSINNGNRIKTYKDMVYVEAEIREIYSQLDSSSYNTKLNRLSKIDELIK